MGTSSSTGAGSLGRVVIVGAGSAGCVLAARLSEHPGAHVTLLEAGHDLRPDATPAAIAGPSFVDAMALPDRTWPGLLATRAAGQAPRVYVRGRGVGGSSAINAMVALRGRPDDYDEWVGRYGCTGWGWAELGPCFDGAALELHRAPRIEWGAMSRALAEAVPSAAAGVLLTRSATGRRVSAADAYLEPARGRANLEVRAGASVDRVLWRDRRAVGVRLADGSELAADTVIVAAGAIHSPALLLRSGVDTPGVGDNLHDHPSFPIALQRREPADVRGLPIATVAAMSSGLDDHGVDDLQLLPIDHVEVTMPGLSLLMAALMFSHSRGSVGLAGDDPTLDPLVEFRMLEDDRDWARMERALDAAERALDHPAMRAVGDVVPFDRSRDAVAAALGDYVHAAGTCAMGTVVDTSCRVVGYEGLLVCDASVMPQVPRANTHWPVVAIAERLSQLLTS
ncbi:MAG: FAD-dependent oxidoreductase [Acidimicrobiales bacterium]